jgi:hypothetical protein
MTRAPRHKKLGAGDFRRPGEPAEWTAQTTVETEPAGDYVEKAKEEKAREKARQRQEERRERAREKEATRPAATSTLASYGSSATVGAT